MCPPSAEEHPVREYLADSNPDALFIDGADAALVGTSHRCGQPDLAVYSHNKLVDVFVGQGMSYEEAEEWVSFNIEGAWVGHGTPIILFEHEF